MLCLLALWTEYLNLKIGYNNPRLVELSSGRTVRMFYEFSDAFFSFFGEPVEMAQRNAGMTWSIRLGGVPFTDPVAALTVFMRNGRMAPGFWPAVALSGEITPRTSPLPNIDESLAVWTAWP
ncbi:MAG: hypothetical protein QGF67_12015 [Lentisphaeria bacterium]|nr:hypothetical protein [Lentisphaeria bacterium]